MFNTLLDMLPNTHVRVAGQVLPTWTATALFGWAAGWWFVTVVATVRGLSPMVAWSLGPVAALTFLGLWELRSEWSDGTHRVLEGGLSVLVVTTTIAALVSGTDWRPWADVIALGVAVALVPGRIGCFSAGCCRGHASSIGRAYPPEPHRRFPVQLVDGGVWAVLAGAAGLAQAADRPGTAAAVVLVGYGTARPMLELLRDNRHRGHAVAGSAVWVVSGGLIVPGTSWASFGVAAVAGTAALALVWTRRNAFIQHADWQADLDALDDLLGAPGAFGTELTPAQTPSWTVVTSRDVERNAVSVSNRHGHAIPAPVVSDIRARIAMIGDRAPEAIDLQHHHTGTWFFSWPREPSSSQTTRSIPLFATPLTDTCESFPPR